MAKIDVEKSNAEYEIARKNFLTDWLRFFENDELQTMLVVMLVLFFLKLGDVITTEGFEKGLMTAIAFGFSADGLNKLTNMNRGD